MSDQESRITQAVVSSSSHKRRPIPTQRMAVAHATMASNPKASKILPRARIEEMPLVGCWAGVGGINCELPKGLVLARVGDGMRSPQATGIHHRAELEVKATVCIGAE